jgi:hypothetical protein
MKINLLIALFYINVVFGEGKSSRVKKVSNSDNFYYPVKIILNNLISTYNKLARIKIDIASNF